MSRQSPLIFPLRYVDRKLTQRPYITHAVTEQFHIKFPVTLAKTNRIFRRERLGRTAINREEKGGKIPSRKWRVR